MESHDILNPPRHRALDRRRRVGKRVWPQEGELRVAFQDLVVWRQRPRRQRSVRARVAPLRERRVHNKLDLRDAAVLVQQLFAVADCCSGNPAGRLNAA